MHPYRSLITVAALAGVMVVMAGVLLNTEHMARKRSREPVAAESWVPLGARRELGPDQAFRRGLDRLALLVASAGEAELARELPGLLEKCVLYVRPEDAGAVRERLEAVDLDPRLRPLLVELLGATRAPDVLADLERAHRSEPEAVLRALRRHGGVEARALAERLSRPPVSESRPVEPAGGAGPGH
ncbi:MAG: hypothetical protein H6807_12370 [Planctomycetes bacterium]|nr:hypothetical protein [Planctomycetota bacterium]